MAQKRFAHHEKRILSKPFKSCYDAREDDLSRLLTYNFAQMNVMADPMILATTSPHQAPTRPQPSMTPKNHASGSIRIIVRRMVTMSEYSPFPTPWNSDDDNIPNAVAG
jgi:hypothetical protein